MDSLFRDETHVTDLRIFKSHDDDHQYIQCRFLFQVTEYWKTNRNVIPRRKSMLASVLFGISPSLLSSHNGLFNLFHSLVHYKFEDSMFFIDSKRLAEKITVKIMSRFSFITTTSCSNLIIALNVDILCKTEFPCQITIEFPHPNLEMDHDAVCSSFNNDEEDMDDDDHNDDSEDNNDDNEDNDEYNNSQMRTEFPHQNLEFDHDAVSSSFNNDEEGMDDDDGNDDHNDGNDDNEDNNDYNDDNDDYDNSFSGFEENIFSNIKGFSEVTGLVDVKPHEVLNSTDCCSICLEEYGSDFSRVAKAETSVCSHMFHKDCIHPWLRKSSNSCPLCRSIFIARI